MLAQFNANFISFILILLTNYVLGNNIDVKTSSGVVRGLSFNVFNETVNQFLGNCYLGYLFLLDCKQGKNV